MAEFSITNYSDDYKVKYIAHPISGDIIGNITQVLAISRQLHIEEGIIPLSPYISFLLYLDDTNTDERMMGVYGDKAVIARAAHDGMDSFGPKLSFGVKQEMNFLKQLGRSITLRNPVLADELEQVLEGYPFAVKPFELKPQYVEAVERNLAGLVNNARWLRKVEKFAELQECAPMFKVNKR